MYQVLARKYRPKNFHQLLGQDHVARALTNAINHQRLHHAYLFTGTRGVGKTTIARILAKCLNCETGITSEPCGVCATCQAIDAGRFIDLIEIDAASRTKVEDTRDLLDNVPYAPSQGRYKVYLIDEVHMLSTHSFNALLKTLEEPPEHVKFLLATTDPQKLPITIVSRCLQFVLRPLPQPMLADYLGQILTTEQVKFDADAVWQLASSGKGSVRDALSLTDQAIAYGNGEIHADTIRQMLGLIDQADVVQLLMTIYQGQTQALSDSMALLRQQVVDAKAVFDHLADVLHQVALLQLLPNIDLQLNRQQTQQLQQLAQLLPADIIQLYYEIVVKSRDTIALANTPLQALEMALLRLLAFRPLTPQQLTPQQTAPQPSISPPAISQQAIPPSAEPQPLQLAPAELSEPSVDQPQPLQLVQSPQYLDSNEVEIQAVIPSAILPINECDNGDFNHLEGVDNLDSLDNTVTFDNMANLDDTVTLDADLDNIDTLGISDYSDTPMPSTIPSILDDVEVVNLANVNADELVTESFATENFATEHNTNVEVDKVETESEIQPVEFVINTTLHQIKQPLVQDLTGEWTADKWDFWVYEAREHGWLADDELVLAKRGVMQGEILGQSEFITDESVLTDTATFSQFRQKLEAKFVGLQVKLHKVAQAEVVTPEQHQQQRDALLQVKMVEHIEKQPVMQYLSQQHASVGLVKLK
ncbi:MULTISPECIES: DNA polymerase III subunit gamma/tau [unclassified Moraxella]|uniref:DNA polymerase III subunit gamma/tau n=1 Tax=unclassified Moraxella TaxID=2685852 RepID=UPI003AF7CF88